MSDTDARIGKRLGELRGEMSQASLAAAMAERGHKWSQATVWSVESAKRPLRLAEALDVAGVLGVEVADLLQSTAAGEVIDGLRSALAEVDRIALILRTGSQDFEGARTRLRGAIRELDESDVQEWSPEEKGRLLEVVREADKRMKWSQADLIWVDSRDDLHWDSIYERGGE